ncbi:MAG: rod shape-determining protein MreC [Candidatus Rokubacteria bacterium 13_1_20CM_2_68_19]|nr:MAG: rod shape-determining protein MreC [Candidatus Rokubacteria bacterium 13_2_20CM_2_64_8]OLD98391.1 MAG: rod shape-determining protein MreC [Candidatus Rokubacteria bacterium 13_1_20CM_4_68_9]OLE45579.1 MAG: rod shape-determining protein MreC [Candidatus Rokubacteria bacterium 13_1_20CM_2_68_19]
MLLTLQTRGRASGAADLVARITTPVQKTLSAIHRGAFGLWSTYLDWKNVRAENRRLRDENQRLRVDALAVSETAEENQRLRRMLELKARLPLNTLTGEIIAREWGGWVRSLTVNRGRADDVKRLTAVISPDGLVGRVVDVRPGAAVVQVLTDPTSTVGAHAVRTRTPGVVEGEPRGTIRFKYMARDGSALQPGDLVVTSGLGGLFPRGIPVGRVRAIDDRGSALFSFATLEPAVNFAKIDEVLLVTGDRMEDVTAYFQTGG